MTISCAEPFLQCVKVFINYKYSLLLYLAVFADRLPVGLGRYGHLVVKVANKMTAVVKSGINGGIENRMIGLQ